MRKLVSTVVALALYGSFAAASGAFAGTHDNTGFSKLVDNQIDETPEEMRLPLFQCASTASMCDMTDAVDESAELVDPPVGAYIIDPDEPGAIIPASLMNEIQMSIDPTDALQGILPDDRCVEKPFECPYRTKCQWLAFGGAWCTVTSCGTGSCPICPGMFPGVFVQSWCAYGCMKGTKMVGGAFMIQTRFRWIGPVCIPA